MTSFAQWRTSWAKQPPLPKAIWVCGDARIWVDEVVDSVIRRFDGDPVAEHADLSELASTKLNLNRNLVVIYVDGIEDWTELQDWLKTRPKKCETHLLLVSGEDRITLGLPAAHGEKPGPAEHILTLRERKGQVVECREPVSESGQRTAFDWLKSKVKMSDQMVRFTLERANYDLRQIRDASEKLRLLDAEISSATISAVLEAQPKLSFVDALFALDKKTAIQSLTGHEDVDQLIGLLDSRLELAGMVHDMQLERRPTPDIRKALGKMSWYLNHLVPIAKHYNHHRRLSIRRHLAEIDELQRSGERTGLLESLVLVW